MPMVASAKKYLKYFLPLTTAKRTNQILRVNPTVTPNRIQVDEVHYEIYQFNNDGFEHHTTTDSNSLLHFIKPSHFVTWINVAGLKKESVEGIAEAFDIHTLIAEDILSENQRPKMDEMGHHLFCLLNMLYFNKQLGAVETEQISFVLGKGFVMSFQEDPKRDVFDSLREKIKVQNSKTRQRTADYLMYQMLDLIVDQYYLVMDDLGDRIEQLEEQVMRYSNIRSLAQINQLRKELIVLKRNVSPVRELVNGCLRSDSELIEERHLKYYKDIYDHIVQAQDLVENYRDMVMSLQDLYLNNVNIRMNEVMKVMAIVTCLMAPATVIGGIFGMNFDIIPYIHNTNGFYVAVAAMILIPVYMLWVFKRRGWY